MKKSVKLNEKSRRFENTKRKQQIEPELWSPGPKNRKKSKAQKSRFFQHFSARFFGRKTLITLVFFGVGKRFWALKNSKTLFYSLNSVVNKFDKK